MHMQPERRMQPAEAGSYRVLLPRSISWPPLGMHENKCSICKQLPSGSEADLTSPTSRGPNHDTHTFTFRENLTCGAQRLDSWVSTTLSAAAAGACTGVCRCCLIRRPRLLPLRLLEERGSQHHCLDSQRRSSNQLQYLCKCFQAPCSQATAIRLPPGHCPVLSHFGKKWLGEEGWPQ